ncbi:bifunctional alpha/beta hydrolase/OsmC family protein [bacterium]|nr:bifunctional alpha/beta hydrolase/OsmC family protein [bacterium]
MTKFDFTNRVGHKLTGRIELPTGTPKSFAIFAHCFTCSKNVKAATQIARELSQLGIAVLRFDFTGLGNSEGDFSNSDFSSNVNDLVDAAAALESHFSAPSLLIGHSLGGAAALMASAEISSVKAVATVGAPSEPAHVENLITNTTKETHDDGSTTISLGGRELLIGNQFINDLKSNRLTELLPVLKKPVLILHSPIDSIVGIDNARQLYEAAKHPKSFVSLDGADHMLSNPTDAKFVAGILAAWASRYLPVDNVSDEVQSIEIEEGAVAIREQAGSLTQAIQTNQHEFYADEPVNHGGNDKGPNPYELLLASLGACTSMTLRMYARHKGLPLESIEVILKHSRIHAEDCATCETQKGKIDRIEKEIIVGGDLTPEQVNRLGEIADRCPVHRTLTNEKLIETKIGHLSKST